LRARKGIKRGPLTEEHKQKLRKPATNTAKENMSKAWVYKKDITCPNCMKTSKNAANMKRWHFDNCKQKYN
jgi:hypothetical protein